MKLLRKAAWRAASTRRASPRIPADGRHNALRRRSIDLADVARHAAGLRRALVAAGVLEPDQATGPAGVSSTLLTQEAWLRSEVTGYWHPGVGVGEAVSAGQHLGDVRDAFGVVLQAVPAPIEGVVLFLVTSLAMNSGDPLLAIGAG